MYQCNTYVFNKCVNVVFYLCVQQSRHEVDGSSSEEESDSEDEEDDLFWTEFLRDMTPQPSPTSQQVITNDLVQF